MSRNVRSRVYYKIFEILLKEIDTTKYMGFYYNVYFHENYMSDNVCRFGIRNLNLLCLCRYKKEDSTRTLTIAHFQFENWYL